LQQFNGSLHAVISLRSFIMEIDFLNGLVSTGQLSADISCGADASDLVAKIGDLELNLLVFCSHP
jgi:hypothetical protein